MNARRVALALATALAVAGCVVGPAPDLGTAELATTTPAPDAPAPDRTATVTRAVDGDTLKIEFPDGAADTVRLIGVDSPEVHAENSPDEFEGVPGTAAGRGCLRRYGERASAVATDRLEGATVGLAFDPNLDRRGYYGRLLAYVVVDGRSFNRRLVERGLARVYESDFSRRDAYRERELAARRDGRGLWACATDDPPAATATASASGLVASEVPPDPPGNDDDRVAEEHVVLTNRGEDPVDLSDRAARDEAGATDAVPGATRLAAGASVTLLTGRGEDAARDRCWGRSRAVRNGGGDAVTVLDAGGTVVTRRSCS